MGALVNLGKILISGKSNLMSLFLLSFCLFTKMTVSCYIFPRKRKASTIWRGLNKLNIILRVQMALDADAV